MLFVLVSFPTRRSSDLICGLTEGTTMTIRLNVNGAVHDLDVESDAPLLWVLRDELGLTGTKFGCGVAQDRKSTRLNSSHTVISYAVFCLKKKIYIIENI